MNENTTVQSNICYKCGESIKTSILMKKHGNAYCDGCYSDAKVSESVITTESLTNPEKPYRNKYSNALHIIAVSELLCSIIVAFYIWIKFGTVDIGLYYTDQVTNPFGIAIGFGVLFQGIIFFILISAVRVIADDVSEMKHHQFQ